MYVNQKTAMTLLLLACAAAFAPVSMAGNASKAAPMKFVGTYYGSSGTVTSFHSDGTMSIVVADMFSDDPASKYEGRKATPGRGAWRVTGANTIRQTNIIFVTEAFGHNFQPGGAILKTTWDAVFDEPVRGRSPGYTLDKTTVEIFLPGQNPITDVPVLVRETPFAGRGIRLEVE